MTLGIAFLIVLLGVVILVAWLIHRFTQNQAATRPSLHLEPPDASWKSRLHPGQICWASLQFADRSGYKVRPCLVVRTHAQGVEVLKITSQDKSHRYDCIQIPTAGWDRRARKDSWLDLSETYFIWDEAIKRTAGSCDATTWRHVTQRHRSGYVYIAEIADQQ
jgi:hypothetical protein